MTILGIDIGTTTLCAAVLDASTRAVLHSETLPGAPFMPSPRGWERTQDAEAAAQAAQALADRLCRRWRCAAVGLTGQMHGVVPVDASGRAVGPLYTWQDGRGDLDEGGGPLARRLSEELEMSLATGYGLVTHVFNRRHGLHPDAAALATIGAYAGMRLTGRKAPLLHASDAASLGGYRADAQAFDARAAALAGGALPESTPRAAWLGKTPGGVPVAVSIGDNQASFLGAVDDPARAVLVNIGTGAQVSVRADRFAADPAFDTRPLDETHYLLVNSPLCGGRSYALLERFLRSCVRLSGAAEQPLYEAMNRIGLELLEDDDLPLVDTRFDGTRANPEMRGSISGIGTRNFDAGRLVAGTVAGIAREIHDLYGLMLAGGMAPANQLIGSGNAIRLNPALKRAFERAFGMEMCIPVHGEEAAYGAALCGMVAAGIKESLEQAQKLIAYVSGSSY